MKGSFLFIMPLVLFSFYSVNAQIPNINQIMNGQYVSIQGCNLEVITNSKAYLPYSIKIYYDPIAQINVTSSASVGTSIHSDNTQSGSYIIFTNDTDDHIIIHASVVYKDQTESSDQERYLHIEYWSNGQLDHVQKSVIYGGKWCSDFYLSTLFKPAPPDIPKMIRDATASLFDKTLKVVQDNTNTIGAVVYLLIGTQFFVIILLGLTGLSRLRGRKKKKKDEKEIRDAIHNATFVLQSQQIHVKQTQVELEKFQKENISLFKEKTDSLINIAEVTMNSIKLEMEKLVANKKPVMEVVESVPEKSVGVKVDAESNKESSFDVAMESAENNDVFDKIKSKISMISKEKKDEETPTSNQMSEEDMLIEKYEEVFSKLRKDDKLDRDKLIDLYNNQLSKEYEKEPTVDLYCKMKAVHRLIFFGDKK